MSTAYRTFDGMPITVLAFGQVSDLCGTAPLQVEGARDTDALEALLRERFPGLKGLTYAVAVDRKTIRGNTPLHPSSVVALLPPYSGG